MMGMPGLRSHGLFTYGKFSFKSGTNKSSVESEPVYDEADRSILYWRHNVTVEFTLQNDSGTDTEMSEARRILGMPGLKFTYKDRGFGQIRVQQRGIHDIESGPKPRVLTWKPTADNKAVDVTWQVQVAVPECIGLGKRKGVIGMTYSASHSVSDNGYVTRTITGTLRVAQGRAGKRVLDSADEYRRKVIARQPLGFRRETDWTVSDAKDALNFRIVDTEIETRYALPPGIIKADLEQGVRFSVAEAGKRYGSLSGSMTVARHYPKETAVVAFLEILKQRAVYAVRGKGAVILQDFRIFDAILGENVRLRADWTYAGKLEDIIKDSGMFLPIGTDWVRWRRSVEPTMNNPYGTSDLMIRSTDDAIVSLCEQNTPVIRPEAKQPRVIRQIPQFQNERPKPENSYISYEQKIEVIEKHRMWQIPILRSSVIDAQIPRSQLNTQGLKLPPGKKDSAVVGKSGDPTYIVKFSGKASRAGYPIPDARLKKIGGQDATLIEHVPVIEKRTYFGLPVYYGAWVGTYALAGPPKNAVVTDDAEGL